MIRYALESFLVAWRHVPGYRKLTSRRTPLMTLFFAQCNTRLQRRGSARVERRGSRHRASALEGCSSPFRPLLKR